MPVFHHAIALSILLGPASAPPPAAAPEPATEVEASDASAPAQAPAPAPAVIPESTAEPDPSWEEDSPEPQPEPVAAVVPAPVSPTPPPPIVDDNAEDIAYQHRQRNRYKGVLISGAAIFGASYLISLTGAVRADKETSSFRRRLAIPLVGPFIAAPQTPSIALRVVTVGLGVTQVAGAALLIVGAVKLPQYPDPDKRSVSFNVLPTRNGAQLGLSGRF